MNVSIVSVSRFDGSPSIGHGTLRNASSRVSGFTPLPS